MANNPTEPQAPENSTPAIPAADRYEDFVRLHTAAGPRLFAFIATLLPHTADAEEVLQNTSVILWRKFGEFQPGTDYVRWACRIAQLEVLNFRRTQPKAQVPFNDALVEELSDERLMRQDRLGDYIRSLRSCLEKLSATDRQLVDLCYSPGAKFNQVASQLQRPLGTVYKALNRIRGRLYDCIQRAMAREGRE